MNDAALLLDVSTLSHPRRSRSSAFRVGAAAGLVLAAMLPAVTPVAAQEQEPTAARIAPARISHRSSRSTRSTIAISRSLSAAASSSRVTACWRPTRTTGRRRPSARALARSERCRGEDPELRPEVRPGHDRQHPSRIRPRYCWRTSRPQRPGRTSWAPARQPQGLEGTVSTGIIGGSPRSAACAICKSRRRSARGAAAGRYLQRSGTRHPHLNRHVGQGPESQLRAPRESPARRSARLDWLHRGQQPTPFDLRDGDRLKDLVYFNNIIEEFGVFAEGSTLNALPRRSRTAPATRSRTSASSWWSRARAARSWTSTCAISRGRYRSPPGLAEAGVDPDLDPRISHVGNRDRLRPRNVRDSLAGLQSRQQPRRRSHQAPIVSASTRSATRGAPYTPGRKEADPGIGAVRRSGAARRRPPHTPSRP